MGFSRQEYWSEVPLPSPLTPSDQIRSDQTDQIRSVAQSCPTLCDPMNRSMQGLPVHHQLNGHEFEQNLGNGEEQGILACCSLWGHKELETTK